MDELPSTEGSSGLTYEKAGVSTAAADEAVALIKQLAESTRTPRVLEGVGPFAAAFHADFEGYDQPLLVASTDGVGTKVKLAPAFGGYRAVGWDVVAVCANDLITTGASPLFFLDYIGCHRVEPKVISEIASGIRDGCLEATMALVGGETAEMRDVYAPDEFDLVGFGVGVVDRNQLITGEHIVTGDLLLALPSSGIHANGLTLARKVFADLPRERWLEEDERLGCSLAEELLKPVLIYVRELKALRDGGVEIKGMAHISGGGIPGNLRRILPPGMNAEVQGSALPQVPIFSYIAELGNVDRREMLNTFNMGLGMVLVLGPGEVEAAQKVGRARGFDLVSVGEIVPGDQRVIIT